VFTWPLWLTLVLTNYLFKCGIEALMTPFTYLAAWGLKKAEGVDIYENDLRLWPRFTPAKSPCQSPQG
jgi:hypothetical protein